MFYNILMSSINVYFELSNLLLQKFQLNVVSHHLSPQGE